MKNDSIGSREQPYPLFAGATADWRLGPDGAGEGQSFVAKLYWDAQPGELALPGVVAVVASVGVCVWASYAGVAWAWYQFAVAAFLALNVGFTVAIGTTPVKRFFHRGGSLWGKDLLTMLVDATCQIVLFDAVFVDATTAGIAWGYSLVLASWVIASGIIITLAPLYIRRAVANTCFLFGTLVALVVLPPIACMQWFPVVVLYKYITAHLPREEPYRPPTQ